MPRWRDPAFAAIADQPSVQHQIPHQEIRVALEPRSSRCRSLQGLLLHTDTRWRLAAPPTLAAARWLRRVPFLIPLGLIAGRPFKPFSRAISSRCSATIRLRSATSPSSFTTSCSSSACDRPDSSGGVVTSRLNRVAPPRRNHFLRHRPRFCPSYTQKGVTIRSRITSAFIVARPVCRGHRANATPIMSAPHPFGSLTRPYRPPGSGPRYSPA